MSTTNKSVVKGAAGKSEWIYLPKRGHVNTNTGITVTLSSGASMTYGVQFTVDDPSIKVGVSIARSTTTATVTLVDHGLIVGDSFKIEAASAPFDGTFDVASVVDANSFTFTVANSGSTSSAAAAVLTRLRAITHAAATGKTANYADKIDVPVFAVRLNITTYGSGKATLAVTNSIA